MEGTRADPESRHGSGKQLHHNGDFVVKNFALRQEAREQEIEVPTIDYSNDFQVLLSKKASKTCLLFKTKATPQARAR